MTCRPPRRFEIPAVPAGRYQVRFIGPWRLAPPTPAPAPRPQPTALAHTGVNVGGLLTLGALLLLSGLTLLRTTIIRRAGR